MANLPANQTTVSTPSSPERRAHREWIGGRALTLLSHYWRDDDPVQLTAAIGADWADVLEGLPQDVIQKACIAYQRQEPRRKPTPGAIYAVARDMMPKPRAVPVGNLKPMRPAEDRVTSEAAASLTAEYLSSSIKRMPGAGQ